MILAPLVFPALAYDAATSATKKKPFRRHLGRVFSGVVGLQLEELWDVVEEGEAEDGDDVVLGRPLVGQLVEWVADGLAAMASNLSFFADDEQVKQARGWGG